MPRAYGNAWRYRHAAVAAIGRRAESGLQVVEHVEIRQVETVLALYSVSDWSLRKHTAEFCGCL